LPENLLAETSHTNQSLRFSPQPARLLKDSELKVGKLMFYLVLKFLYGTGPWLTKVEEFDLAEQLLPTVWEVRVPLNETQKANKKRRRRTLLYISLYILLKNVPVGHIPSKEEKDTLLSILTNLGVESTFLYRSWGGMNRDYHQVFETLKVKLNRPERPTKERKRRRSSEDSRGNAQHRVWKEGLLNLSLPENPVELRVVIELLRTVEELFRKGVLYRQSLPSG